MKNIVVPDPETCLLLKQIGFPQEGGMYYWDFNYEDPELVLFVVKITASWTNPSYVNGLVRAPTYFEIVKLIGRNDFFRNNLSLIATAIVDGQEIDEEILLYGIIKKIMELKSTLGGHL